MQGIRLDTSCFPPKTRLEFGLRSAMALLRASKSKLPARNYAECRASQAGHSQVYSQCLETLKLQCCCWAKMVKAYIACPGVFEQQVNSGTIHFPDIPKLVSGVEHPEHLFVVLSEIFADRLQTLVRSFTNCRCQDQPTHTNFMELLPHHLYLCTQLVRVLHEIPSMRHTAEDIGLSYQDIEWFSRATMLRTVMLEAAKQGGMKDEVAVQAMRHADRLIKLAPDNPASYEFRAYIEMHSLDAAFDSACMYMQTAMRTAKQSGDELGAAQYTMQVMYCMLWKLSTSKSKNRRSDAIALEPELQQVLLSAGTADTIARLPPYDRMAPSSWQHAASVRLLTAAATVAKLAFAIPECPQQLLEYLQPLIARLPRKRADGMKPQDDKRHQTTHSRNSIKAGWGAYNGSIPEARQGQRRKIAAKKRQNSTAAPQVMTSGKQRPAGCSSKVRLHMHSYTDPATTPLAQAAGKQHKI
ncbi:hypothetical protein ABBQ32_007526 [Trebouxia sp. C0010 RCD-2024]